MSTSLNYNGQTINGVLFDLDGTLLDTASDLGAAANALLARDSLPLLSDDTIYHTASQGALALIKAGYGNDLDEMRYQQLRQQFLLSYQQNIANHTRYFESVEHCLSQLDQHGIVWGIVTNKPTLYTEQLLEHFPRLANCAITVCGDTLPVCKPNPDPLLLAAKALALAPEEIAYVGDARTDIEAAQHAHMVSIAASYGYIPRHDPCVAWHSDLIIDRCKDLFSVLSKSV